MANRYWVGGTGTWDASNTANWSATSGGAGGASVPTSADGAIFNASSGAGVCTIAAVVPCLFMYTSGYTGTIAFGSNKVQIYGNNTTVFEGAATYSITGTPLVDLVYSGSVGTRTIVSGTPTEANAVSFNITAGTDIIAGPATGKNLDFTGFSGTLAAGTRTIYGGLTLSSGMTLAATVNNLVFASTSASPQFITSNGRVFDNPIRFNGVGGVWKLADKLTIAAGRSVTLFNGTFDANDKDVEIGSFLTSTGTKTLTLGTGTWVVKDAGTSWNANDATLTVSASTATISMTNASAKTFAGGGKVWPTLNQGGTGALTVQQSNTFANITNTVQPATITLTAGTTQTVTNFTASGTSGNLITLNSSSAGSRATLLDNSGVVSVSYLSIRDIAATGSADWQAYTSNGNVDAGNNIGWEFTNPSPILAAEYPVSFRSFTERRSF